LRGQPKQNSYVSLKSESVPPWQRDRFVPAIINCPVTLSHCALGAGAAGASRIVLSAALVPQAPAPLSEAKGQACANITLSLRLTRSS